jgi:hypothetical protein
MWHETFDAALLPQKKKNLFVEIKQTNRYKTNTFLVCPESKTHCLNFIKGKC